MTSEQKAVIKFLLLIDNQTTSYFTFGMSTAIAFKEEDAERPRDEDDLLISKLLLAHQVQRSGCGHRSTEETDCILTPEKRILVSMSITQMNVERLVVSHLGSTTG